MFWGLTNAILNSWAGVLYRQSLRLSTVSPETFMQLGNLAGFLLAIVFTFAYPDFFAHVTPKIAVLFVVIMLSAYSNNMRMQGLSKTEKVSTMQIFGTLSTVITLVVGFFFFSDTSVTTLCLVILAGAIVMVSQFKGTRFDPPESFWLLVWAYSVAAANGLLVTYLIKQTSAISYFIIATTMQACFLAGLMFVRKKGLRELLSGTKPFYTYRFGTGFIGQASRVISFFLIGSLGPVVSTLLGMLSNIASLVLSVAVLKEKPTPKEWAVNIALMLCIGLGFYFK